MSRTPEPVAIQSVLRGIRRPPPKRRHLSLIVARRPLPEILAAAKLAAVSLLEMRGIQPNDPITQRICEVIELTMRHSVDSVTPKERRKCPVSHSR